VVEAAEVRGGDEAGERARHGAHAEELRDGEAEQDLVEELRREQQQRAQSRGSRARGRWVGALAGRPWEAGSPRGAVPARAPAAPPPRPRPPIEIEERGTDWLLENGEF